MMESGDTKPAKRKFKRKLTPFLCREMLYDYAIGELDADRRVAVEEFLKSDSECQRVLEEIRSGLEYSERLASVQVKVPVLHELNEAENALSLGRRYSSWQEWPDSLRWSLTALVASLLIAGVVSVVPWKNIPALRQVIGSATKANKPEVIEVAQLANPSDQAQLEAAQDQHEGDIVDEGSGDEETEIALEDAPVNQQAPATTPPPQATAPSSLVAKSSSGLVETGPTPNLLQASPGQIVPQPTPTKPVAQATVSVDEHESSPPPTREAKPKGFVSRAFMTLGNLDEIGPKIVDHVVELGGEKAGEVELGWKRGTGRYYHFAIPEESQEKLLEKLRAYGPVRISKDPHPRVMPAGQVRFILWIEAGEL